MIILKIFAALLCSGTDPAGTCLVRQWPDDGRHDVPRPKRMPYKKAVPKGQNPLGHTLFPIPPALFRPLLSMNIPDRKGAPKPDTQFHTSPFISCHPIAAERGLVR